MGVRVRSHSFMSLGNKKTQIDNPGSVVYANAYQLTFRGFTLTTKLGINSQLCVYVHSNALWSS